ncbi:hypothetical protein A2960_01405 [Candidatus Gottesmanbacteria bacterium RIFCSPLOWO2_01_FULL_39_12b]|uniref:GGDEF domain-containing protein n=1 Tax=Candidatus Gottesmanbacteria bacterium RIFCSPLOWO2_01_FULL_39_12b TaxID=1798388 RepID=A0A1F6AQ41_9BACT|nr:MAG: hypothetical protein A2960_01405 [Candidatus Gottesmanbacteria bacterium RIFCSPLOWO2_01_FULL_39_12b]
MSETVPSLTSEPPVKFAENRYRVRDPIPHIMVNPRDRKITRANPAALVEYGLTGNETLVGRDVDEILNDRTIKDRKGYLHKIFETTISAARAFSHHKPLSVVNPPEVKIITKSGRKKTVRLFPHLIIKRGKPTVVELGIQDVTKEKRDEALRKTSEILTRDHSLDIILDQTKRLLPNIIDVETANIMFIDKNRIFNMSWGYDGNGQVIEREPSIEKIEDAEPLNQIAKTGKMLVIPDTSQHKGWKDTTRDGELPIKSYVGIPIIVKGKTIGILSANSSHEGFFNEGDGENVFAFGEQLSQAINMSALINDLNRLATTDHLTGLFNRRVFFERLADQFNQARRSNRPISLIMADLDFFKRFNDTFGHPAGDERLEQVARILCDNVRQTDLVARYGGEEFAIILPDTDTAGATTLAQKILQAMRERLPKNNDTDDNPGSTLSIGIASFPTVRVESEQVLLIKADDALYKAKKDGRNQVCIASESPSNNP